MLVPLLLVQVWGAVVSKGLLYMEVCEGDSITLPCEGPAIAETQRVEVLWKTANGLVNWLSGGKVTPGPSYKDRVTLGDTKKNDFSLTIKTVHPSDNEIYECDINKQMLSEIRLSVKASDEPRCVGKKRPDEQGLTVSPDNNVAVTDPESTADRNHPGLIAGGVAAVLVLVLGAVLLILRRRRNGDPDNDVM